MSEYCLTIGGEKGIDFYTSYIKRELVDQLLGYRGITVSTVL